MAENTPIMTSMPTVMPSKTDAILRDAVERKRQAKSFRTTFYSNRRNLSSASSHSLGNISKFSGNTDIQQNVSPEEMLKKIVASVTHEFRICKQTTCVKFEPTGCKWTASLSKSIDDVRFNRKFSMEVVVSAVSPDIACDSPDSFHVIHVVFIPDPNHIDDDDDESKQAKAIFESMAIKLQGAIIRCQFPVFPEGTSGKKFKQCYQLNAKLNKGAFATVCRGTHRETKTPVAVKCIFRKNLTPEQEATTYEEVSIIASLYHPNIIPLIDFFEEDQCFFLVMELMEGGDLFDRFSEMKNYSEKDGRLLCRRILESVKYCHISQVAHCDIKPKNIMLLSREDDMSIKLADFGFAARVTGPKSLTKQCGTPYYVAPEILRRKPYDEAADLWSVGVIVYLLLSGELPFTGKSFPGLCKNILKGEYTFHEDKWRHMSDEAKDLIKHLLVTNPDERYTAQEALDSDWFQRKADEELEMNDLGDSVKDLQVFAAKMRMKTSVMAVIAANTLCDIAATKIAASDDNDAEPIQLDIEPDNIN